MMSEEARSNLWFYTIVQNAMITAEGVVRESINQHIEALLSLEERTNEYLRVAGAEIAETVNVPVTGSLELTFILIPGLTVIRGFQVQVEW
jgi:hypothetical protein